MPKRTDRAEMRPFGGLATWRQAVAVATELGAGLQREEVMPLGAAAGRVLSRDATARMDVPSHDRAAMDGYAVRAGEASSGLPMRVRGRAAAGETRVLGPGPGECIEVATGALLPESADAVVPVEATDRQGDLVRTSLPVAVGQHVSRRGEDLGRGQTIAGAGQVLQPALLAACAAGGVAEAWVWARPRVLVAPTGDEVVALGAELRPGQVYDSNAAGLLALIDEAGGDGRHAGIVIDDVAALVEILGDRNHDLVVTIGGTSVGRRDLVVEAMRQVGTILVHGVAVKPGKPLLLGRLGPRPMLGLPGFPTTCMMLGYALLDPLVRCLGHRPRLRPQREAILGADASPPGGKAQLLPVAVVEGVATPTFTLSSSVSSMSRADGWIEIPAETGGIARGERVVVHLF